MRPYDQQLTDDDLRLGGVALIGGFALLGTAIVALAYRNEKEHASIRQVHDDLEDRHQVLAGFVFFENEAEESQSLPQYGVPANWPEPKQIFFSPPDLQPEPQPALSLPFASTNPALTEHISDVIEQALLSAARKIPQHNTDAISTLDAPASPFVLPTLKSPFMSKQVMDAIDHAVTTAITKKGLGRT